MNVQSKVESATAERRPIPGQIVLVLQGGGALGAYQAGVYQALHEAGFEPDLVIGTSIGAINASLIAGNPFEARIDRIDEFWRRIAHGGLKDRLAASPFMAAANWMTLMQGIAPFFQPNPAAFVSLHAPLGAERAGYYSTAPLRRTLEELVDFERINRGPMRLTVGAANVRTGEMRYPAAPVADFLTAVLSNHHRHHESPGNLTPADVYFGRGQAIRAESEKIKKLTIQSRRLSHHARAA